MPVRSKSFGLAAIWIGIAHNLSLLNEHAVREFYDRAYRECRIINKPQVSPPCAVQELVQVCKQLRGWRKR